MQLLGQRPLGIAMLVLLVALVAVKRLATGSILEYKAKDNFWVWFTNLFNLFFLLVVNPVTAILLVTQNLEGLDPTHLSLKLPSLVAGLELLGLGLYGAGYLLMAGALLWLGRNYQLGGSAPRAGDEMVIVGPYRFIRHPMYAAALSISLGLALTLQSLALLAVSGIYLGLILSIIPFEETRLLQVYREQYPLYQKQVKKLVPYLF